MKYELPKLTYELNQLEPVIGEDTLAVHYSKHHQTYLNNLNDLLEKEQSTNDYDLVALISNPSLIPESIRQGVINNGGGYLNHNLYWETITPNGKENLEMLNVINERFGTFEEFKELFSTAAKTHFGSGWVWLVKNLDGKLEIITTQNQDSPLTLGLTPILTLDVWEHAYYLNYQNRRVEYIENWFSIINWDNVYQNYLNA